MKIYKILVTGIIALGSLNAYSQDVTVPINSNLILDGTNRWIFHTPDNGSQIAYFAPWLGSDWGWDRFQFNYGGNLQMAGRLKANGLSIGSNDYLGSGDLNAIEFPAAEILYATTNPQNQFYISTNTYYNGGFKYRNSAPASGIGMDGGGINIWTAPAGSANSATPLNSQLSITNDGKVGVGVPAPDSKLNVGGNVKIFAASEAWAEGITIVRSAGWGGMRITRNNPASGNFEGNWAIGYNANTGNDYSISTYNAGQYDGVFHISNTTRNVGIGTTIPDEKLTVNGRIHATEVKVTATVPGPDYVFEESYVLPSLEEVKSYIDENKHLPEVPSAKEMEKNGINLGEMNMLLLKKMEEMTLYLIEQEKRIKVLEEKLKN